MWNALRTYEVDGILIKIWTKNARGNERWNSIDIGICSKNAQNVNDWMCFCEGSTNSDLVESYRNYKFSSVTILLSKTRGEVRNQWSLSEISY